jgi:predicted HTH domain antitoxin
MLANNPLNNESQLFFQNQNNKNPNITSENCSKLENLKLIDSAGVNTAENSLNKISAIETFKNKKETYLQIHQKKVNEIIINNYGTEIYDFSVELEDRNFHPYPLQNHKIDNDIRTKLIDWMLEVLSAYNSGIFTFNLSVQIMDMYVAKCKSVLVNKDIHLIGVVAMFIASKMEDIMPIRMSHVRTKISHGKFSERDIRKKEKAVLELLNFEIITTSTSDFIKTFVYDFIHNNRAQIENLEMWHHIDAFENVTIFLAKLIHHNVEFNQFK